MGFAHFLDELGNTLLCRPMARVHEFSFLHFFDDMGILLVCRPLRYIHRFAEFLVGWLKSDRYVDENWPVEEVIWLVRDIVDK
jgi:hypothetical protein